MRVLDLSRLLPGMYCASILANFGAEVIKIEPPGGGDWMRYIPPLENGESILFCSLARGTKSMTLNLKAEAGREIFLRLVEGADVVLESFRPGVMQRLGLDYDILARTNPRLVYCSLSGYGPDGPYNQRAGHDLNYIGLAGLLDLGGAYDGPPAIPGVQLADLGGALWAVIGIQQALLERQHTGRGQQLDSSLFGAALSFLPVALAGLSGGLPQRRGENQLNGGLVCYNVYRTKDGGYMTLAALEPKFWADFCRAVERLAWLDRAFAPARPGEAAYDDLCALFESRTRQEWQALFAGVDACCEPVYSLDEALDSAPVRTSGILAGNGLLLPLRRTSQPTSLAGEAPGLGQHTSGLLAGLGYLPEQISELVSQRII